MTDPIDALVPGDVSNGERPLAIPSELPILPLRDTVLFPNSFMPLAVAREASVRLVEEANASGKLIGVFTQREAAVEEPLQEDLYLVYTGKSETDRPIIKAHLNPLVMWLWIGIWVVIFGTALALVPNRAAVALKQPSRARAAAVEVGD